MCCSALVTPPKSRHGTGDQMASGGAYQTQAGGASACRGAAASCLRRQSVMSGSAVITPEHQKRTLKVMKSDGSIQPAH